MVSSILTTPALRTYMALIKSACLTVDGVLVDAMLEVTQDEANGDNVEHRNRSSGADGDVPAASPSDVKRLLSSWLEAFRSNLIPCPVVNQFFTQMFTFMDLRLFSTLLQRPDLCSVSNAFQIKLRLSSVEGFVHTFTSPLLNASDLQFTLIREAANVLIVNDDSLADPKAWPDICGHLEMAHVHKLLSNLQPDLLHPSPVASSVLDAVKRTVTEFPEEDLDPFALPTLSLSKLDLDYKIPIDINSVPLPSRLTLLPMLSFLQSVR